MGVHGGRHWNDGVSLGPRARFDETTKPHPLLWIEDLREADGGTYRCRVDFKQAPTKNSKVNLQVIGELTQLILPASKALFRGRIYREYPKELSVVCITPTLPYTEDKRLSIKCMF